MATCCKNKTKMKQKKRGSKKFKANLWLAI